MNMKNQINRKNLILIIGMVFTALNATASCKVDTIYDSDRYAGTASNRKLSRLIYTYNSSNNITSSFLQTFNGDSAGYLAYERDTFIYNASNKLIIKSSERYNVSTGLWRKDKKTDYVYAASGILIEETNSYGFGLPSWQLGNKTIYTVDGANNVIEEVYQSWVSATSSWKNLKKWTRVYTANRLTSETRYDYNNTTIVWDEKEKTDFKRNGLGQVTQSILFYAATSSSIWDSLERFTYSYTGTNVTFETSEEKATNTSPWVYFSKAFQKFNTSTFQLLERRELEYDATNNVWDSVQKEVYTYSAANDLVQYKRFSLFDVPTDLYGWYSQKDYKCAGFNVGIEEPIKEETFSLYPNPVASNNISINTIEKADYSLFNMAGKQLQTGALSVGENHIQLENISAGIYFVRLNNQTKKLIVQ